MLQKIEQVKHRHGISFVLCQSINNLKMQPFTCLLQENQNQMESVLEQELEALSTNDLLNYIVYDTIYPSPPPQITNLPLNNGENTNDYKNNPPISEKPVNKPKRKRRRREKVCKNKEEAETQRMTHITVERNRRKQMNGHLAVLKSLMPESYVQRGDQASIVGGAIEYVKELEHLLQTLESQQILLHHRTNATSSSSGEFLQPPPSPPFSQFFSRPQYTWTTNQNYMNNSNNSCTIVNNNNSYYTYNNNATSSSTRSNDVADIEVSLIETHANVRILSRRSFSQLSKMVAAFHSLSLSILHLNVTTLAPLVLYSISAKVEEGCQLTSADDIAGAVHHMLRIIEDEVSLC